MNMELEQRMIDLESRVAFQEHHLQELSDALADYRAQDAQTSLTLHQLREEIRQLRMTMSNSPVTGDASAEPPPPHY